MASIYGLTDQKRPKSLLDQSFLYKRTSKCADAHGSLFACDFHLNEGNAPVLVKNELSITEEASVLKENYGRKWDMRN